MDNNEQPNQSIFEVDEILVTVLSHLMEDRQWISELSMTSKSYVDNNMNLGFFKI